MSAAGGGLGPLLALYALRFARELVLQLEPGIGEGVVNPGGEEAGFEPAARSDVLFDPRRGTWFPLPRLHLFDKRIHLRNRKPAFWPFVGAG
jgi:hypothetical protein